MRNWIVLTLCVSLMVAAQSLWKVGLSRIGTLDVGQAWGPQLLSVVRTWQILGGIALFGLTTFLWLDLLSRMELSLLYPMMSLAYVLAFFVGWIALGERPDLGRLLGILVIVAGIVLVARSGR